MATPPQLTGTDNHNLPEIPPLDTRYENEWGFIYNSGKFGDGTDAGVDGLIRAIEERTPVQDTDANKTNYTPYESQIFIATDTDIIYRGNGTDWETFIDASQIDTSAIFNEIDQLRQDQYDSVDQYYVSPGGDDANNNGKSWRNSFATIDKALDAIRSRRAVGVQKDPITIRVESGDYTINNPQTVPANVSIVGNDLRTVRLKPANPKLDFFHVNSLVYIEGVRFKNHQAPAFCVSYERAIAEPVITDQGDLTEINLLYSPDGYLEGDNSATPQVLVDEPRSGVRAEASVLSITNGKIDGITVDAAGSGYQTKPNISIPAPEDTQPYIVGSPYVFNCSCITGPFDVDGKRVPQTAPLPYATEGGTTFNDPIKGKEFTFSDIDPEGAGGGMLVDGRLTFGRNDMTSVDANSDKPQTRIASMVGANFTLVNQGGPGHLVENDGFAQFVSMFTTYCTYGFKTKSGGLALLSNSVCDFGIEGLVAEGRQSEPYTTGTSVDTRESSVGGIEVRKGGTGYTTATVDIDAPTGTNATQATATAIINNGTIANIQVDQQGDGYRSKPNVTISGDGTGAEAEAEMSKVSTIELESLDTFTQPDGSNVVRTPEVNSELDLAPGDENDPLLTTWEELPNGNYKISFRPGVFAVDINQDVGLFAVSTVNTSAHTFEFPGSGFTYNALPRFGGVPDRTVLSNEFNGGNVFFTASDEIGNFYVGNQFKVDQQSGEVTLSTDAFNLSDVEGIGPFSVGGVTSGVQLREVSNRTDLLTNSGLQSNAVATINALRSFFLQGDRTVPNGGQDGQALTKLSADDRDVDWEYPVPTGGTDGQALAKQSGTDLDFDWETLVPNGGASGQSLIKNSNTDFDSDWQYALPNGGSDGDALLKQSGTDQDFDWESISQFTDQKAIDALEASTSSIAIDISGDADTVDGFNIAVDGTDGSPGDNKINFKTQ